MNDSDEVPFTPSLLRDDPYERFIARVPFLIAIPCLVVAVVLWFWHPLPKEPNAIVLGIVCAILCFDLPVCLVATIGWIATGKLPAFSLTPLIPCREEREYKRILLNRPKLSDDEFYDKFYADTRIPKPLVVQLRASLEQGLGRDFGGLHPLDNLFYVDCDIDVADVYLRISREFEVVISDNRMNQLDPTYDSLLRCLFNRSRGR